MRHLYAFAGVLVLGAAWALCRLTAHIGGRGLGTAYTVEDLGTLGGAESWAQAINDRGWVVGKAQTASGQWHAFLYRSGTMKDLGTLGGPESEAFGLNNRGDVVGRSATHRSGVVHAFVYHGGGLQDLGTLGLHSWATAINDKGEVAGAYGFESPSPGFHAFTYGAGKMHDLGTLGGADSEATAINDRGQVVGWSHTRGSSTFTAHAFLYQGGRLQDLGTLGGEFSHAVAINGAGQVGGYSRASDSPWSQRAFVWKDGHMQDEGSLAGGSCVVGGMNSHCDMVGFEWGKNGGPPHIFVRTGGTVKDLRSLVADPGWTLLNPRGINDSGKIVVDGFGKRGERHALLLKPVRISSGDLGIL